MPATLTPLRYPGGKTTYTDLFVDIISMNKLENCTFVEVFAGGAGAAITLLLKGHVKALFLNDLSVAIYAFWKCVKEQPSDLIDLIQSKRISMAEWRRQKAVYDVKDTSDMLALGFATFYLNRCNHSGILEARPVGGMKQTGTYSISSRYRKSTSIQKIKAIAEHAESMEVFNLDGAEFVKMLKRKHRDRKFLVYFDPPYHQKGPALYLNHFSKQDHEALRDIILKCPFPWVLSYDNHEEIIALYRGRRCGLRRSQIRHTISGNTNSEELVISQLSLPGYLERLHSRSRSR